MPKENLLENFSLNDDSQSFFGIKGTGEDKSSINTTLNTIRKNDPLGDDDDADDDAPTKIDDDKEVKKHKEEKVAITKVEKVDKEDKEDKTTKEDKKDKKVKGDDKSEDDDVKFTFGAEDEDDDADDDANKSKDKKEKIGKENKEGKDKEESVVDEDDSKFYSALAKELKENDIFITAEIPDKEDLTYDEFIEHFDNEIEARVAESFEAFAEKLPDEGKQLMKYLTNGGTIAKFLEIKRKDINLKDFKEDDVKQHESIIRFYLDEDGKDEEEIEQQLQWLKDSGKTKTTAEKYFKSIKKKQEVAIGELEKEQERINKAKEKGVKVFNDTVAKIITSSDKVGAFPISIKEKKELQEYITKPSVKVGKDSYVPQFHVALDSILNPKNEEDIKKLVILGKLLRNNFDISDLVIAKSTKDVSETRNRLRDTKRNIKPGTGGVSKSRSLSEFFN